MKLTTRIEYIENILRQQRYEPSTIETKTFKGKLCRIWYTITFILFYYYPQRTLQKKLTIARQLREPNITLEDGDLLFLSYRQKEK